MGLESFLVGFAYHLRSGHSIGKHARLYQVLMLSVAVFIYLRWAHLVLISVLHFAAIVVFWS